MLKRLELLVEENIKFSFENLHNGITIDSQIDNCDGNCLSGNYANKSLSISDVLCKKRDAWDCFCKSGNRIAIATSGGKDSMALAIAMQNLGIPILCLIVNHDLRATSGKEAAEVSAILSAYGIGSEILHWKHGEVSTGIEEKAREARYKLLIEKCKLLNIKHLCFAHHMNDQAETVLLNLARGSGIDGLCGMKYVIERDEIFIIRPMLNVSRMQIEEFIDTQQIRYVTDPSNTDMNISRNLLRKCLLHIVPDYQLLNKRIAMIAQHAQYASRQVSNYEGDIIKSISSNNKFQSLQIDITSSIYCAWSADERLSLISRALRFISGTYQKGRLDCVKLLVDAIESSRTGKRELMHCQISWDRNGIRITRSAKKCKAKCSAKQRITEMSSPRN